MRIKNNISALNAQIALKINESKLTKDLEKLTSGYRINRSGDDAAGLAISEQMRSQIAGLTQGELNAKDGLGLLRTGEGAMQEIHAMLIRMNGLAIRSANGVYTDEGHRQLLQEEVDRISQEIDRIASATRFNYVKLFHDDASMASDSGLTPPVTTFALGTGNGTVKTASAGQTDAAVAAFNLSSVGAPDSNVAVAALDLSGADTVPAFDPPGVDATGSGSEAADEIKKELQKEIEKKVNALTTDYAAMGDPVTKATAGSDKKDAMEQILKNIPGSPVKDKVEAAAANADSSMLFSGSSSKTRTATNIANLNTKAVSGASNGSKLVFQIGPDAAHTISIPRFYLSKAALGLNDFDVSTQESAQESIGKVEDMINYVSQIRGAYGAVDNALEHAMNSMNVYKENLTAAESRIRDTDMAKELTERTKDQILAQTAQAMLAQANALPESALSLLQ